MQILSNANAVEGANFLGIDTPKVMHYRRGGSAARCIIVWSHIVHKSTLRHIDRLCIAGPVSVVHRAPHRIEVLRQSQRMLAFQCDDINIRYFHKRVDESSHCAPEPTSLEHRMLVLDAMSVTDLAFLSTPHMHNKMEIEVDISNMMSGLCQRTKE